jgi:hypothetical protein
MTASHRSFAAARRALPLAVLGACLMLGGAMAADPEPMAVIQGAWPSGAGATTSVFTVKGASGRLTTVTAADRKAGYSENDVLVQGLAFSKSDAAPDGGRRLHYTATCRSRDNAGGKLSWMVTDCTLTVIVPPRSSQDGQKLRVSGATSLIRGDRTPAVRLAGGEEDGHGGADARTPARTTVLEAAPAPAPADGESWARRNMTPEELAAQDKATNALNADVQARLDAADARDAKKAADFRAAKAAHDAKVKADKAAYDREVADYQARVAANEAANAKARADWQAAVRACKAGDVSQCAK